MEETTTAITAVKEEVRLRDWAAQIEAQQASGMTSVEMVSTYYTFPALSSRPINASSALSNNSYLQMKDTKCVRSLRFVTGFVTLLETSRRWVHFSIRVGSLYKPPEYQLQLNINHNKGLL